MKSKRSTVIGNTVIVVLLSIVAVLGVYLTLIAATSANFPQGSTPGQISVPSAHHSPHKPLRSPQKHPHHSGTHSRTPGRGRGSTAHSAPSGGTHHSGIPVSGTSSRPTQAPQPFPTPTPRPTPKPTPTPSPTSHIPTPRLPLPHVSVSVPPIKLPLVTVTVPVVQIP